MHPIERLRYVARASGADQAMLVRETAGALAAFADDPAGLVTACRRIVSRHPGSGPLWWLCSRVLTATEPMREAWAASDELDEDRTSYALAHAIADEASVCVIGWPDLVGDALRRRGDLDVLVVDALGEGAGLVRVLERADVAVTDVPVTGTAAAAAEADLVLLEAAAVGPAGALAVSGSRAAAAVASTSGTPVWLTAGVGRHLPNRVWDCMVQRLDRACDPWDADEELVPMDLIDRVVGPDGPEDPAAARKRTDCPIAPELFKEL
jgi:hypothetical protein